MESLWQAFKQSALMEFVYSLNIETQIFLVTILLFTLIFHLTYTPKTADKAPAFLTTLGILGTFVGIAIGLMDFNTLYIEASVPMLIEGIKTAVWASAFGIFCALTIKLRDIEGFARHRKSEAQKPRLDELIAALWAVEKALRAQEQKPHRAAESASAGTVYVNAAPSQIERGHTEDKQF